MDERPLAVVTGANRGIGLEVARQLTDCGYEVIAGSRDLAEGERSVSGIEHAEAHQLDVADEQSVAALADFLRGQGRPVRALVNNAGVHYDTGQSALDPDPRVVREAVEVNVLGAWRMTVAINALMDDGARIVNVSSGAGSFAESAGSAGAPAYSVTKAALNMLTVKLAAELSSRGIRVNAVCPGWVATDMGGSGGRPVAEGARGIVWAATLPVDGPTGGFFRNGRTVPW